MTTSDSRARRTSSDPRTPKDMAVSLERTIRDDPNPRATWKGATRSTNGPSVLVDTDAGQTFVATIRNVDANLVAEVAGILETHPGASPQYLAREILTHLGFPA